MLRQSLLVLPLVLCGCMGGVIQSVALAPGQTPDIDKPVDIIVSGSGKCGRLTVNWGDNGQNAGDDYYNVDLTAQPHLTHTYTGWRGGRTVNVKGEYACLGTVVTHFATSPNIMGFAWSRKPSGMNPTPCFNAPSVASPSGDMPPLPANSVVHVTADPSPQVNFGCSFNGCIYDPDGKPGSAPSTFSFPGFRDYSLVLRVNGQTLFQGGTSAAPFKTASGGRLEFCQNTDNPTANITGGWGIWVRVDEQGFVPQ